MANEFTMFVRGHECRVTGEIEGADRSVGIMSDYFLLHDVMSLEYRGHMPVVHLNAEELTRGELREIEEAFWDSQAPAGNCVWSWDGLAYD